MQKSTKMKSLKRFGIALILIVLAAIAAISYYLYSKKPQYNNNLQLNVLTAPVDVLFDDNAIPHIYAQNEEDAYTALGYVHAQERLFQMEIIRRLATGHLSEIFGNKTIESDRFFRTLSFKEQATKSIAQIYSDPGDQTLTDAKAYLRGINKYLELGKTPIEFDLLGIPKETFSLEDCLIVGGYMGFGFSEAFNVDPLMTAIHEKYGDAYIKDLMNDWEQDAPMLPSFDGKSLSATETLLSFSKNLQKIKQQAEVLPPYHGSNSWIVSANRTKNKQVLFENDTHIAYGQPSVFFEASLSFPGHNIYGNFLAGFPFPVIGHNDNGAIGLTMLENDDVDFYKETYNPLNNKQVRYRDTFVDIVSRKEIIRVKGEKNIDLEVRKTPHGYLMNGVMDDYETTATPVSMWWTYYQFPDHILHASYQFTKAKNVQDVQQAASLIHAPGLNVMWGDKDGNIAWFAAAKLPKRPKNQRPYMLLDGASGKDEIEGWYEFDENPHNINPPSGFVYSANNQPDIYKNYPKLNGYYVPKDRAERIVSYMNGSKNDFSASDFQKMALDDTSKVQAMMAHQIATIANETLRNNEQKEIISYLKNWKGGHAVNAIEPVIYYRTLYFIIKNTFNDELQGDDFDAFLRSSTLVKTLPILMNNQASVWWDNIETKNKIESQRSIIGKSVAEAIDALKTQLGNDVSQWQWGKVHTLTHKHPLSVMPLVGSYFNVGPFPVPGGKETINNLDLNFEKNGVYNVPFGPALRRILDFSDTNHAKSINPSGNSGNVMSPYYGNQGSAFANGQFRTEYILREDVEKVKIGHLVLR